MVTAILPEVTLVEDNHDDEELSLAGIRKSGVPCNVTVGRDGEAALDLLLGQRPAPTLVLLDYKLPKLNGLEVLTRLRLEEQTRFVPVVVFSGTNVGSAIKECYRIGANSCVTKPDDAAGYVELVQVVTHYWLTANRKLEDDFAPQSRRIYQGFRERNI